MKYYDIHVNDGVNSYSVFVKSKLSLEDKDDCQAIDMDKLDQDDVNHIDNVTEIDRAEYVRATQN